MPPNKPWTARRARGLKPLAALAALLPALAGAGSNLVVNGSFDSTNGAPAGWTFNYEYTGNQLYAGNHQHLKVAADGERKNVLVMTGNKALLSDPGPGIKVDSTPIPFEKGGKYRLTVSARSTGANARIFVEGYRWLPGVKPHPNPELKELRKCFKFDLVHFSADKTGPLSNPGPNWSRDSQDFPRDKPSELAQESLNRVQFLVVHIIAISGVTDSGGGGGDVSLFVDDVALEKIN